MLDLPDAAVAILDTTVTAFAGVDIPERRYVFVGRPVVDCDQLVVWLQGVTFSLPGAEVAQVKGGPTVHTASFAIGLWRCVPVVDDAGNPPAVAKLDTSGLALLRDAEILSKLRKSYREALSGCTGLRMSSLLADDEEGGYSGNVLSIEVQF